MNAPSTESMFDSESSLSETPAASLGETPGARLMARRLERGLSLGDIARQLKLSVRQIEALERDDHASFPGPMFVRGFLRNYAKLLQVDPDSLLVSDSLPPVPKAPDVQQPESFAPVSARSPEHGRKIVAWGALAAMVVVGLFLLSSQVSKDQPEHLTLAPGAAREPAPPSAAGLTMHAESPPPAPAIAAAAPSPVQAAPEEPAVVAPPPAPVPSAVATPDITHTPVAEPPAAVASSHDMSASSGVGRIRMSFEAESWVEVVDASGETIFSRLNDAGTQRVVEGTPPLQVIVGNARGVKFEYKDKAVDLEPFTRVHVARFTLE